MTAAAIAQPSGSLVADTIVIGGGGKQLSRLEAWFPGLACKLEVAQDDLDQEKDYEYKKSRIVMITRLLT